MSDYIAGLYPNVSLEDNGTPERTQVNNLFIYSWPVEEQGVCPGVVTAIEYCYQRDVNLLVGPPIFSLLFLKEVSTGFKVTQRIDVAPQSFSTCLLRGGVDTCCERQRLEQQNWFGVPSESTAFGIFAKGRNRILGYGPGQDGQTAGYQLPIDRMDDGLIKVPTLNDTITIKYRMFNLIIGK